MADTHNPDDFQTKHLSGCLVRLCWMFFGNLVLLLIAVAVSAHRDDLFSIADAAFWLAVLGLAAIRYLDVTRLRGSTTSGEPASLAHWRRYIVLLGAFALCLWGAAHAVAFYQSRL